MEVHGGRGDLQITRQLDLAFGFERDPRCRPRSGYWWPRHIRPYDRRPWCWWHRSRRCPAPPGDHRPAWPGPLTTGTRSTPKTLPVTAAPLPRIRPRGVPWPTSLTSLMAAFGIAELEQAGFHGHPDGGAHLNGIHAVIVVQEIHHGRWHPGHRCRNCRHGPRRSRIRAVWSDNGRPCHNRFPNSG